MLKYAAALRVLRDLITHQEYVRPDGDGTAVEAALDRIMETISVLDYDQDYFPAAELAQITNDSRAVVPNSLFIAISGARTDGAKFIDQAVRSGAVVVVTGRNIDDPPAGVIVLTVRDTYAAYARLCEAETDFPDRKLTGFAITGTNGKTTSVMLWRLLLNAAQHPCGMISTVEYDLGGGEIIPAERTTPEAASLFAQLERMNQHQLQYFAMETSSHALAQDRIGLMRFRAAVFTNLTGDHLDYHHTMEAYFAAKCRLFQEHLTADGVAVVNADDPWGRRLAELPGLPRVATFGRDHGQWRILDVSTHRTGSDFTLVNGGVRVPIHTNLVGMHNIYNLAGVILSLHETATISAYECAEILAARPLAVPGRLEAIELLGGATAFVDYAHTDDALKNVLDCLRRLQPRRILTVFGAGGDRDATKRPRMGLAAACNSDALYITSDNPRSEDPCAIIDAVAAGVPSEFPDVRKITDRREAIATALRDAGPGDFVLIAGKGHETYQEIAGVRHHFDDREVVRAFNRPA